MAKQPPIRVALDLETTGLHAEQDAILEVAAIKFQGTTILDTYDTLVAPGRTIPYRVQRLTGITPQLVSDAPHFETIARQLSLFLGDFPIVGHSIPFDMGFLRHRGLVRTNPLIDTFELATVILPSLPSYNLGQVAEALGVTVVLGRHRAMVDTTLAMQVFLALYERLQAIDLSLLKDLANLNAPRSWPLLGFFQQELRNRQIQEGLYGTSLRGSLGDQFAAQLGMDPRILSFAIAHEDIQAVDSQPKRPEGPLPAASPLPPLQTEPLGVLSPVGSDNDGNESVSKTSTIAQVTGEQIDISSGEDLPLHLFPPSHLSVEPLVEVPLASNLQTLIEVVPTNGSSTSGVSVFGNGDYREDDLQHSVSEEDLQGDAALRPMRQPTPSGYQSAYRAVHEALENCTPLLMEVTTGTNDYVPALLPALEWLSQTPVDGDATSLTPRRLVIACANSQGARRIVETVLPRLQAALNSQFPVAYLAEGNGYLCVHRWFGSALRRTSGELSSEEARGLAKLGLWAQQTLTGERSELTLLPQEMAAWDRISSGVERIPLDLSGGRSDTPYSQCTYRRKGYCFVGRAEEHVKHASIVVTTHAGLFDDLSSSHSLLKTIDRRLILDTDLLEDEYARWANTELDAARLLELLNTIGTELPENRYQGLLALAAPSLRENGPGGLSATPTIGKSELDSRMLSWFQTLRYTSGAIEDFFHAVGHLLEEFQQQGSNGHGQNKSKAGKAGKADTVGRPSAHRNNERTDSTVRLTGQMRNLATWSDVERTSKQVTERLQTVINLVREAERIILTAKPRLSRLSAGPGEENSVAWELAALIQRLMEQQQLVQQAVESLTLQPGKDGESEKVYWLRLPTGGPQAQYQMAQQRQPEQGNAPVHTAQNLPVLYAQPIQTASLLKDTLLSPGSCAIFAGIALSVDNNFSFYRNLYGLDADTCPAFSVVTEHHEQTLLYLPNDVPEPNMPQYQRHLDDAIVQLATALDGELVVLFTSYASLRSSYAAVKPLLEARGILVLGHGIDGSPRQLWQMFSNSERVVLLGTGSFWDGIDEITRTPACIVVARLPMPVLNDPPLAARVEHYSDQLHHVTVPMAALRIRRALNRLAWGSDKRNAIVLFDRRIISKEYGSMVLNTLPHCSQRQGPVSHMSEIVLDWLTATGSWE